MATSQVRAGLHYVGVGCFVIVIFGLGIGTVRTMPDYAILVLNDRTHTYIAPPCLSPAQYQQLINDLGNDESAGRELRLATAQEARGLKYKPDPECRDYDGFVHVRSVTGHLLELVGILRSRWNSDGAWNW